MTGPIDPTGPIDRVDPDEPAAPVDPAVRAVPTDQGRRGRRLAVIGVVLALVVALATGAHAYLTLVPVGPDATAGPGQTVRVAGVDYRLDGFDVASVFPPADAGDGPVRSPAGSMIVLVRFTQTIVQRSVGLDDHFCDFSLRTDDSTWVPDDTVAYRIRRPARLTCSRTDDQPLSYGRAVLVGVAFLVPVADASRVTFRVATDGGHHLIELRR